MTAFSKIIQTVSAATPQKQPAKPVASSTSLSLNHLVKVCAKAMDLLEAKTPRASFKTAVIAGSIAKIMQLPNRDVASIVYAALLHDIGFARLTPEIVRHLPPNGSEKTLYQEHALLNAKVISKPADQMQTDNLTHFIQQHPLYAKPFVAALRLSSDVTALIESHHELCDGSGYPFGLSAEQIPLGAKILTFADVVECILETIVKDASTLVSRKQALESFMEIKAPGKFDPEVIQVFSSLITTNDDFLRLLHTLDVETMLDALLPQRDVALSEDAVLSILTALSESADATMAGYKDGRSKRVATLAASLAQSIEIHPEQQGELYLAGLIMDIGHLATPAHILFQPKQLSLEDKLSIYDHPRHTAEIFKGLPGFDNIILWASEHHERLNGKGYPSQKRGSEISIGGRLLALADVYEALTHERPFRPYTYEAIDALPVIGQGRQTLYDTELVGVLKSVIMNASLPGL